MVTLRSGIRLMGTAGDNDTGRFIDHVVREFMKEFVKPDVHNLFVQNGPLATTGRETHGLRHLLPAGFRKSTYENAGGHGQDGVAEQFYQFSPVLSFLRGWENYFEKISE
mmetsp:Transcript_13989/g.39777  ORF Transcript_13989/g.39777 Transcript_13989/m.39777 type:complete len:110 (-) Transcript_13989:202-531(-)